MSRTISRMTAEQRAADKAEKLVVRLARREELKLNVLRDFLRGKISFNAISKSSSYKGRGMRVDRAYPRLEKMLVAWTLIMANPTVFHFRVTDEGLVGDLSKALGIIYPNDSYISDTSLNNGLHVMSNGRGVKATPSIEIVALVHEHIGNIDGGIAQYLHEHGQKPPTELDVEVIRAVCPTIETLKDIPPASTVDKPQKTVTAAERTRAAKPPVDPHVDTIAKRAHEELKELYGPKVLARLKHLL